MNAFIVSEEFRKTTQNLYFLGSAGIISKIYNVTADQFTVLPQPFRNPNLNVAGFFGIAVLYLIVSLTLRYLVEFCDHERSYFDTAKKKILEARSIDDLINVDISDPTIQGLYSGISKKHGRYLVLLINSQKALFLLDVVAPFLFFVLCCAELSQSTKIFLMDVFARS